MCLSFFCFFSSGIEEHIIIIIFQYVVYIFWIYIFYDTKLYVLDSFKLVSLNVKIYYKYVEYVNIYTHFVIYYFRLYFIREYVLYVIKLRNMGVT